MGLPRNVEQSDLISYGIFGLIDAIDKFDLERGFKFETYGISRVRGAILDELRALDWVPRSVRARAREIERSLTELEHREKRSVTEEELADHMSIKVDDLLDHLAEIATLGLVALDELLSPDRGSSAVGDMLPDPRGTNPEAAFQIEEMKRAPFPSGSLINRPLTWLYHARPPRPPAVRCLDIWGGQGLPSSGTGGRRL